MSSATVYVLERFIDRTDMAGTKGLMLSFDQVFGSKSIITILRQILITYNFMTSEEILSKLPYSKPFLFVDEIIKITENGVEGHFTFDRILIFTRDILRTIR
jgi:hypothetical protein